jgi:hypothetical protein
MVATLPPWTCPFCAQLIEAPTLEDRWNHCLDLHLASLRQAKAEYLAAVSKAIR